MLSLMALAGMQQILHYFRWFFFFYVSGVDFTVQRVSETRLEPTLRLSILGLRYAGPRHWNFLDSLQEKELSFVVFVAFSLTFVALQRKKKREKNEHRENA